MIGQSFAPLGDQNDPVKPQNQPGSNPVQEAIKVLTLRMPRVLGGGAPAAPELLNSMGGAAVQNPVAAFLAQLFGQQGQQGSRPEVMSSPWGQPAPAPAPAPAPLPRLEYQEPGVEGPPPPSRPGTSVPPRSPFQNRPNPN
jgi:hypothetical protein